MVKSPSLKLIKLTLWKKNKNLIVLTENLYVRKVLTLNLKKIRLSTDFKIQFHHIIKMANKIHLL